jgi:hypothetical protein
MKPNQAAFDVGQLAADMADGYSAHSAAMTIVGRLDEQTLRRVTWGNDPVGYAPCKDGNKWQFGLLGFLQLTTTRPAIAEELPRVWLAGSLLTVGDALERNGYFDHAPELELVYHLRNGIAHGNRFEIRNRKRLAKYPAHNRNVWPKRPNTPGTFEINTALHGQRVLFDFMQAGDVLEHLAYVSLHLKRIGNGEPLRPTP